MTRYRPARKRQRPHPLTLVAPLDARRTARSAVVAVTHDPAPGDHAYVCGSPGCRRFVYIDNEASIDWLIAYHRKLGVVDKSKIVVRCPQHVSEYAMRLAGVKVNERSRQRVRVAKARDDRALMSSTSPLLEPFTTAVGVGRSRKARG